MLQDQDAPVASPPAAISSPSEAPEAPVDPKARMHRRRTCDINIPDDWAMQFDSPAQTATNPHKARSPVLEESLDLTPPALVPMDSNDDAARRERLNHRKSQVRFSIAPDTIHTIEDMPSSSDSETSPTDTDTTALEPVPVATCPLPQSPPQNQPLPTPQAMDKQVDPPALSPEKCLPSPKKPSQVSSPTGSDSNKHYNDRCDDADETALQSLTKQPRTKYSMSPSLSKLFSQTPAKKAGPSTPTDACTPATVSEPASTTPGLRAVDEGMLISLKTPAPPRAVPAAGRGRLSIDGDLSAYGDLTDLLAKTPKPLPNEPPVTSSDAKQYPSSLLIPVTPAPSLIDTVRNDIISPERIPKYSFIEMEEIKRHYEAKVSTSMAKKEEEFQQQLNVLQEQLAQTAAECKELKVLLTDYDETIMKAINDAELKQQEHDGEMQQACTERESLQLSIKTMQMSIDDLEDQ
ncbi:hypothetical protein H4R35_006824, partial [Dimargaris xerosporica]